MIIIAAIQVVIQVVVRLILKCSLSNLYFATLIGLHIEKTELSKLSYHKI